MANRIHIVVAEPSVIIRSGVISVLKRLNMLNIDVAEISDISMLSVMLCKLRPDILIIDPSQLGIFSLQQIKNDVGCCAVKVIALQNTLTDSATLKHYDQTISIYDNSDTIKEKLVGIIQSDDKSEAKQELSVREKEIMVCVVKGMTNKQIAESLCLSSHTIIAHRRNIANKLQIHSPAGLTIYAIVNKLVEINDVKYTITSQE